MVASNIPPFFPDLDLPPWTPTESGLIVPGAGFIDDREMDHWMNTLSRWGDQVQDWSEYEKRCGVELWSSVNNAAIAGFGGTALISYDTVDANYGKWIVPTTATFTTITAPPGSDGIYTATLSVYFAAGIAGGQILAGIRRNGNAVMSSIATAGDRTTVGVAGFRVTAGDTISTFVVNGTGAAYTPTSFAGDANSPRLPGLLLYRLSR